MKRAALILSALALAACGHGKYDEHGYSETGVHEHHDDRGVVPAADEFSVDAAERICSINSLTEAYEEMRTVVRQSAYESDGHEGGLFSDYDDPDYSRSTNTRTQNEHVATTRPYGRQTETVELVRAFETDLDAAYRFATASCQSYAMCMHQNGYDEYECNNSRLQWREARSDFTRLSERLAEIRLEITTTCTACRLSVPAPYHRPYAPARHHPYPPHYDRGYCHQGYCRDDAYCDHDYCGAYYDDDCDDVLGDVFTTSTCHYPRPHGYRRPY